MTKEEVLEKLATDIRLCDMSEGTVVLDKYKIKSHFYMKFIGYEIKNDAYKNTLICNNNFKEQEGGSMSNILRQSITDGKWVYSVEEL